MDLEWILSKYNYWACIALMMIGFYAMIAKRNLVKKIIGLNIFQTAIILFFISIAAKKDATIPILAHSAEELGHHLTQYINPLPHTLMLTAIVVAVCTTGVALALIIMIHERYHTLEDDEIIKQDK